MSCGYWMFCVVDIDSFYQIDHSMLTWPCRSKLVNVVSGVPQSSVLAALLSSCAPRSFLYNLFGYVDYSTLIAVVQSPGIRVTVAESLSRDFVKVCEWCDLWGMTLNAIKTKTMIVSRSCTMHPQSPALTIGCGEGVW